MTEESPPCCPTAEPTKSSSESCCPPLPPQNNSDVSATCETDCCCPPQPTAEPSHPPLTGGRELAGYNIATYVSSWLSTPVGEVPQVFSQLSWNDRLGRWAMRWGIGRERYRVTPGLYAVGEPNDSSPLLVSANYKMSFDCLRNALIGTAAWILVLDTQGINVWCAAGKGTFGTEEIVRRCNQHRLGELLSHRTMIVPQLAAPGVAAYQVRQQTGFRVVYGPVRAKDLQSFLAAGMEASERMRQVSFSTLERLVLTPVEIMILRKPILIAILLLFILSGIGADIFSFSAAWHRGLAAVCAGLTGVVTGCVLTPVLLPWIPSRAFAAKGALLGLICATLLALGPYREAGASGWICLYLTVMSVASYTAMNFSGSSTFTSPSGVEKEMRWAIPFQSLALLVAGLIWIAAAF